MSLKTELYKMVEDNEGGSISCARIVSWSCAILGMILLTLYFFGIGTNPDPAYTMIGLGMGAGTLKSVLPNNSEHVEVKVVEKEENKDE